MTEQADEQQPRFCPYCRRFHVREESQGNESATPCSILPEPVTHSPCDKCKHYDRCAEEKLACYRFAYFVEQDIKKGTKGNPTHEIYLQVFDNERPFRPGSARFSKKRVNKCFTRKRIHRKPQQDQQEPIGYE